LKPPAALSERQGLANMLACISVLVSAVVDAPLVALFTLPVFIAGPPRPVSLRGQPSCPSSLERTAYAELVPFFLDGLKPLLAAGAVPAEAGTWLLGRSHERLVFVARLLSAGLGWVTVEVRGLELQDPTSCHHVEASRIDAEFRRVLGDEASGPTRSVWDEAEFRDVGRSDTNSVFAMAPLCRVPGLTTLQSTSLSLTGMLDSKEALKLTHALFYHALLYVLAEELKAQGKAVDFLPEAWATKVRAETLRKSVAEFPHTYSSMLGMPVLQPRSEARRQPTRPESREQRNLVEDTSSSKGSTDRQHQSPDRQQQAEQAVTVTSGFAPTVNGAVSNRIDLGGSVAMSRPGARNAQPPVKVDTRGGPPVAASRERANSGSSEPTPPQRDNPSQQRSASRPLASGGPSRATPAIAPDVMSQVTAAGSLDIDDELDKLFDEVMGPVDAPGKDATKPKQPGQEPPSPVAGKDSDANLDAELDAFAASFPANLVPPAAHGSRPGSSAGNLLLDVGHHKVLQTEDRSAARFGAAENRSPPRGFAENMPNDAPSRPAVAADRGRSRGQTQPVSPARGTPGTGSSVRSVSERGPVEVASVPELAAALYASANITPLAGHAWEAGARHVAQVWAGTRWLPENAPPAPLKEMIVRAFRLAVHVALELLVLGEEEVPEVDEVNSQFEEAEATWLFRPVEEWATLVDAGLGAQRSVAAVCLEGSALQLHRLQRTCEDGMLAVLDATTVTSFWSGIDIELRFFANADEERYSIQAHPTLLRNLLSQAKEYPVYVSEPITMKW
jgi:hypothetical protein